MVTEILSFYTPYADVERMEHALSSVLQEEITVMRKSSQRFYLDLQDNEFLEIPFVTVNSDPSMFQTQIRKLYASSEKLPCEDPYIKQNLLYQIALFRSAYVFTFNYQETKRNEKILPLMEIADQMDALIFWETGDISDSYGDIILNRQGKSEVSVFNPVDGFDLTNKTLGLSESQMKRIHHSLSVLRYKGIYAPTYIAPPFEENMYLFQEEEQICKRAVACMMLAMYTKQLIMQQGNAMLAYEKVEQVIRKYHASPYFTISEIEYLNDRQPIAKDIRKYRLYFECAYTLFWALCLFDSLYFPNAFCAAETIMDHICSYDTMETLLQKAKMRKKEEILDALDLIQRYDWACCDAKKLGFQIPGGLLYDVVKMRHQSLSWMVAEREVSWDEVQPKIHALKLKRNNTVPL